MRKPLMRLGFLPVGVVAYWLHSEAGAEQVESPIFLCREQRSGARNRLDMHGETESRFSGLCKGNPYMATLSTLKPPYPLEVTPLLAATK